MRLPWIALLAALLSVPASAAVPAKPRAATLVQVVHRDARLAGGALDDGAVTAAADLAAQELTGKPLALDAWAALAGGRPVAVVARPAAGPLARAILARARLAGRATLVEGDAPAPAGSRVIAVLAPAWRDRAPVLPQVPAGAAAFVDLFEPAIGLDTAPTVVAWRADTLLAARDGAVASAAAEYVLRAHGEGRIPDWKALLAAHGRAGARVAWSRRALD